MTYTYDGHTKAIARQMMDLPGARFRNILDLPAPWCRSIQHYLDVGSITPETQVTAVEFVKSFVPRIERKLTSLGVKNFEVFPGDLSRCPNHGPFDLVNLDTCSTLSVPMLKWIGQLQFLPHSQLNVWVTAYRSSNKMKQTLLKTFFDTEIGRGIIRQMEKENGRFKDATQVQQVQAAAVYSVLNQYSFVVDEPYKYTENINRMYVYRMLDIQRLSVPKCPNLFEFISYEERIPMSYSRSKTKIESAPTLPARILDAIKSGKPGVKAAVKKQVKKAVRDGVLEGKSAFWVKAGLKSNVSRLCNGTSPASLKQKAHEFIAAA